LFFIDLSLISRKPRCEAGLFFLCQTEKIFPEKFSQERPQFLIPVLHWGVQQKCSRIFWAKLADSLNFQTGYFMLLGSI